MCRHKPSQSRNISNTANGFEPLSLGRFGAFPENGSATSPLIFLPTAPKAFGAASFALSAKKSARR
jgi:hypothetical protein